MSNKEKGHMDSKKRQSEHKLSKHKAQGTSQFIEAVFADAIQHHQAGQLHEAEQFYRQVLTLNPRHADSLHLLGVIALQVGRYDLAVDLIGQAVAIDEKVALYHSNLGSALKASGCPDQSIAAYRKAISLNPQYPEAHNNLGTVLQAQKQLEQAAMQFRKATDLKPDFAEAHNNMGNVLVEQGQLNDAVVSYRKAIELRQDYSEAHNNLGTALKELGELDEAARCYKKAINLKPDFAEAYNNLSILLKKQGQLDEAIACCHKAIDCKPDLPESYYNLAVALADQGKLNEAVIYYRKTIDLKSDFPEAHNNLAMALLALGDMAEGWQEYEWRWKTARMSSFLRNFSQPQWQGEAAVGRTLLIHAEQGFGDTIQFCRYAALAIAKGLRVIMEVQKPLVRLMQNLPGIERIIAYGEELPAFDMHCPILSMPLALGTTVATIPNAPSYLYADVRDIAAWHARLTKMNVRGFKVGLAWEGNPATASDSRRSITPNRLAPLLDISGVHFFSLQKVGAKALQNIALTDFMEEMTDFGDTAALVANLDLVISVDTAVAHLAAALGKSVWLLDRFDSDWRWFVGRRDSPWYPTLRIYRQAQLGDWNSVLVKVAEDLQHFAATGLIAS